MRTTALRYISLVVICAFIITTCKKDDKVTDLEITDVTVSDNTVIIKGTINSLSGNKNSDYGVCYAISNSNPSATDTSLNLGQPKVGTFSAEIKNLKRNKTYNFRGFIKEGDTYIYDQVRTAQIIAIPPTATTKAASAAAETTITLNGSVNPNGTATTVSFEYGTTVSYGSTIVASTNVITGTSLTDVSANLTGLIPNTTYHFRVKATNAAGTVTGEDLTFITHLSASASATSSAATSVTSTTATLNGSVNANGSTTAVSFEYGTTFLYGLIASATPASVGGVTPVTVTSALTGLISGQLYHFRVKAVSAGGTVYSDDMTFTTTMPPSATTQNASGITLTSATLNGLVNANGLSTTITFEYGTSTSYGTTVDGVPGNASGTSNTAVTAALTGLTGNTIYHFRVKASSNGGVVYGQDLTFSTYISPIAVTTSALMIYPTTATLTGYVNGNGNTTSIKFQYGTSTSYGTTLYGIPDNATGSSDIYSIVNLTGLSRNTLYHFRIVAENISGTTYGNDITFTTLQNDPTVPTVTTKAVANITSESAIGGGIITNNGGAEVTERGICYSRTDPNPTVDDFRTSNGEGIGEYSSPFTGLPPSTFYYVRAYAKNMIGIAYGSVVTFTTDVPPADLPTLSTITVADITHNSASSGGNISDNGGGTITARGVCWSTSEYPTTSDSKSIDGTGSGIYASSIIGLNANTFYYIRAYATNSAGTAYGDQLVFTTSDPPAGIATLTTIAGSDITTSTFTSGGNITDDGGGTITGKGVCYGTSSGPTISGTRTSDGGGTGIFVSNVSGLSASTLYYVRAYATNSAGTAYGSQVTVTTAAPVPVLPTVTTTSVNPVTYNSGTGGGNVTSEGNATVTARGVCWSTSPGPTTDNSKTTNGAGPGSFSSSITGLNYSTLYYVRAYATNSVGTAYGSEVTFTTSALPWVVPTLTTTTQSSVTSSTASTGGNISSDGGASVTARGVCYGNSPNPTILDNITSNGTGPGSFTSNMTGLSGSTLYYVRAYATNAAGTAYGNQISFTTPVEAGAPLLTTSAASAISSTSATSGGNITDDGDAGGPVTIAAKGVCWSTAANPTTANSKTSDGTGTGVFTSSLTSLTPCTTYHIRAYATNSAGFTAYGADLTFTTGSVLATVTTTTLTSATSVSVSTGGTISGDCSSTVTERGVCWGTASAPTTSGSKLTNGTGSGVYAITITGLTPCTTYYIRAYAVNASGTQYGNELSFTTSTVQASVTTTAATSITSTTATSGGTISGNCTTGATRGICYATTSNPTTSNSVINSGTGAGAYSIPISGLIPCTTYYVRAFVTNSAGTAYATQISFTTGVALPTVVTTAISSISATTAVSGGTVSGNCNSGITARGICWSTSPSPTVALATRTIQTGTSGSFTSNITSLTRVTTYYVRAYATNAAGTSYGNEISFTTIAAIPTVSSTAISIFSNSTVVGGGNVTDEGGASVTIRGICWSTSSNPTIANSYTSDGSGLGSFISNASGLSSGTTYYVRAYATNASGTGYGINRSFTTPLTVTDYDGNVYGAVSIGGNVWMQSNLRVKHWSNAPIGGGSDTSLYVALPLWYQYNDLSTYGTRYGLMYNWSAVTSSYNICPTGWHVPSVTEWGTLATSLGGYTVAASKMTQLYAYEKTSYGFARVDYWNTAITGHDNSSLFYARGGGYYSGAFAGLLDNTRWWTSASQRYVKIQYNSNYIYGTSSTYTGLASDAYYIRCKKD